MLMTFGIFKFWKIVKVDAIDNSHSKIFTTQLGLNIYVYKNLMLMTFGIFKIWKIVKVDAIDNSHSEIFTTQQLKT